MIESVFVVQVEFCNRGVVFPFDEFPKVQSGIIIVYMGPSVVEDELSVSWVGVIVRSVWVRAR